MTSRHDAPARPRSGLYRHSVDVLSLFFGLAFATIGLIAVAVPGGLIGVDLSLVLGAVAITGGLTAIVGMTLRGGPTQEVAEPHPRTAIAPTAEQLRREDADWLDAGSRIADVRSEIERAIEAEVQRDMAAARESAEGDERNRTEGE